MNIPDILSKLKEPAQKILNNKDSTLSFLQKIQQKMSQTESPKIDEIKKDTKNGISMIRAYVKGDYRNVPWQSILFVTMALVYFLNPLDVIPDFIPLKGFIDDATVLVFVLNAVKGDLDAFMSWKQSQPDTDEAE
ncbi:MAG: DUF1232 domain-containing protein [Pseudobacteriovorax sp.]|nr:DUF1232 domain-containing protein [Pseudobacteriovorax sp.]